MKKLFNKLIFILLLSFSFNLSINATGYCAYKISGNTDYFGSEDNKEFYGQVNSNHECYLLFRFASNYTDWTNFFKGTAVENTCDKNIFNPIQLYCKNISYDNYYNHDSADEEEGYETIIYGINAYSSISTQGTDEYNRIYIGYGAAPSITGSTSDDEYKHALLRFIYENVETNDSNPCTNKYLNINDSLIGYMDISFGASGISGEQFDTKEEFFQAKGINNGYRNGELCHEIEGNFIPEWTRTQQDVHFFDITNVINEVSRTEPESPVPYLKGNQKCYMAIDTQKGENDFWTENDMFYQNTGGLPERVFLPIQVYCTSDVEITAIYNESSAIYQLLPYGYDEYSEYFEVIFTLSDETLNSYSRFTSYITNTGMSEFNPEKEFYIWNSGRQVYIFLDNENDTDETGLVQVTLPYLGLYPTGSQFFESHNLQVPTPNPDPDDGSNGNNRPGANAGKPSDKYEGLSTCTDLDVNKIKACGCIPAAIADISSKIYFILRIVGPILLLILGGFEMAKAITTEDESAIEKAKRKLVNKFIAAAAIFLILTVMKLVVSLLSKNAGDIIRCIDILLGGYEI